MKTAIKSLTPLHKNYPTNLLSLTPPPPLLYVKGNILSQDKQAIALIGTRNMTRYGQKITKKFAQSFVKVGLTIVSGLARGIDTVAHQTALNSGGRTIAVLGSGLDLIYPPENLNLAQKIIQNGALISEFTPGTKPLGKNFLARNRLISALSLAVVVIEGAQKSGTLSTATHAANQNREVFAVPGPIDSPQSQAPHYLIQQGAHLATCPEDVLDIIL
jgi:DNA processing protein